MDRHSHSIVEVVSYRIDDAAKPLSCSDREALQLGDDDIDPPLIAGGDAVTGERCTQRTVSGASDSSFVSYDLRSDVSIDRSSRFALLRPWDDDASALRCAACRVAFSFRRRKHHCRACGKVLCKACTDNVGGWMEEGFSAYC